jgi:hypothetical protein
MGLKSGAVSMRYLVRFWRTRHIKTLNSSIRFRQDTEAMRTVTNRVYAKTVNELGL